MSLLNDLASLFHHQAPAISPNAGNPPHQLRVVAPPANSFQRPQDIEQPQDAQGNFQGIELPGYTPLQRAGYTTHLQPQQQFGQQQLQAGVPMYNLNYLVNYGRPSAPYSYLPTLSQPQFTSYNSMTQE